MRTESAVAEFGMLLRDSPHKGQASLDALIARASGALAADEGSFRQEFVELARTVQRKELIVAR
jgi:Ca-activated chloride channel family protein